MKVTKILRPPPAAKFAAMRLLKAAVAAPMKPNKAATVRGSTTKGQQSAPL